MFTFRTFDRLSVQSLLCAKTAVILGLALSWSMNCHAANNSVAGNDSSFQHYPERPVPPMESPNILVIMTDDVGFSATSTFGGAIPTPTLSSLAQEGLRFTQFHTTAMCSPTRAALLTGRNHHAVDTGAILNIADDRQGYTGVLPKSAATVAKVLQDFGYATAFLGKNHNTPLWENTPVGPYDNWPNAWGFDFFYGFNAAYADQFHPSLIRNRDPIDPPKDGEYMLDKDLSNQAIHWLQIQKNLKPSQPFFIYWAPGTVHSPHQAPDEWIAKFKGKFDGGWDQLRKDTFERQQAERIIPLNAELTERPKEFPSWQSLSNEERRIYARMMEVAAAQLSYNDFQIGRVIDWLKVSGEFDNTLIFFIQGDNGASIESFTGATNELQSLSGKEPTLEELTKNIDEHGRDGSFPNYPAAWAWATNVPFKWGKQMASHLGGIRNGLVVTWPQGISRQQNGGVRSQFHHVIDIVPTIYEVLDITPPSTIDGIEQKSLDGVSMAYSFNDEDAPDRNTSQYFEMLGNRSYYRDGWLASTVPQVPPWDRAHTVDPESLEWELYHLDEDFSQAHNVAAEFPEKLADLKQEFQIVAEKNHVLPVQANMMERYRHGHRPSLIKRRDSLSYYPGKTRYSEAAWPDMSDNSEWRAQVTVEKKQCSGTIFVKGTQSSGATLALEDCRPVFYFDPLGSDEGRMVLKGKQKLTEGSSLITIAFSRLEDGSRVEAQLFVDGNVVAESAVPRVFRVLGDAYVGDPGQQTVTGGGQLHMTEPTHFSVDRIDFIRD